MGEDVIGGRSREGLRACLLFFVAMPEEGWDGTAS